jgi:acetate kinase
MNIFVVNSGSSSIKYQVFKMPSEKPICTGLIERIGQENGTITHKVYDGDTEDVIEKNTKIADHEAGLREVVSLLTDKDLGVIQNTDDINIVGHRVVHGGEAFSATTEITEEVKKKIKSLFSLAPLHNPPNYQGIEVAEKIFTKAKQVAVFDTAFHSEMPERAYRYAIPNSLYSEQGIRAYGFHGTSHKFVSAQAMSYLKNQNAKIITIHLGNGCSMAAIEGGRSVDTTMGFGPNSGLIMGTRSGDVDPSIIFHLISQEGKSSVEVNNLLNKKSGMLGLTGFSDMRDITKALYEGNSAAKLAYELYAYRIKKYIGAYTAVLNGLDAIIFTAGVGENDALTRKLVCEKMEYLGIELDEEKNKLRGKIIRKINTETSKVKILVIPTNEELEIAKQCWELGRQ